MFFNVCNLCPVILKRFRTTSITGSRVWKDSSRSIQSGAKSTLVVKVGLVFLKGTSQTAPPNPVLTTQNTPGIRMFSTSSSVSFWELRGFVCRGRQSLFPQARPCTQAKGFLKSWMVHCTGPFRSIVVESTQNAPKDER